jgi:hypothetical protein
LVKRQSSSIEILSRGDVGVGSALDNEVPITTRKVKAKLKMSFNLESLVLTESKRHGLWVIKYRVGGPYGKSRLTTSR